MPGRTAPPRPGLLGARSCAGKGACMLDHKHEMIRFLSTGNGKGESGAVTLGFLEYRHPDDESDRRNLEIRWLYVDPAHRRQGIGSALIEACLKLAECLSCTWLS